MRQGRWMKFVWGRLRAHAYLESSTYDLETRRPSIVNKWMNGWISEWTVMTNGQVQSIGYRIDRPNKTIPRSDKEHKIKKENILPQEGWQRCWKTAMEDDENAYSWLLTEYSLVDLSWTYSRGWNELIKTQRALLYTELARLSTWNAAKLMVIYIFTIRIYP